uniref:MBD domain-containing protein n=1 Tax=Chenopodium quinoa TaxID=63459 RepID=A0A803M0F5_CHEQI
YYTDPVNGYIFRSLKDIDRYLLSGKLGKHVTKNKPKDSEDANFDFIQHTKRARNESKGGKTGAETPKETVEKTISKPLRGRSSRTKKKRESTPFFILDPDQCEDSSAVSIPNISEIIDSMLKEKENPKTVYLSAPAIGSLLGEKLSETRTNISYKKPKFSVNICKDNVAGSNKFPCTGISSDLKVKKEDLESKSIARPHQDQEPTAVDQKCDRMITDCKAKEGPESPLFADLFEDPCIDFAIKTLTGTSAFGV